MNFWPSFPKQGTKAPPNSEKQQDSLLDFEHTFSFKHVYVGTHFKKDKSDFFHQYFCLCFGGDGKGGCFRRNPRGLLGGFLPKMDWP